MRTLIFLILCAALCAGCSGGNAGFTPDDAQRLSLTVLPESYDLGGSAETSLSTRPEAGGVAVDRYAFHYRYSLGRPDYVSGSADIELFDRVQGRLKASVVAQPGEPSPGPETRIDFDITWDPAAVPPPLGG